MDDAQLKLEPPNQTRLGHGVCKHLMPYKAQQKNLVMTSLGLCRTRTFHSTALYLGAAQFAAAAASQRHQATYPQARKSIQTHSLPRPPQTQRLPSNGLIESAPALRFCANPETLLAGHFR